MATPSQHPPAQPQQGVIQRFTNQGGAGWLGDLASYGLLTYTGGIVSGKAEGRGSIRCNGGSAGGWTLHDAELLAGRLLPCVAVLAFDNGNAYAGPVRGSGFPADGACGAVVLGRNGGRFQGVWPANGEDNKWWRPLGGAAWDPADGGSLHAVSLSGAPTDAIVSASGDHSGWRPGGPGWVRVGSLVGADGQVPPPRPSSPATQQHSACVSLFRIGGFCVCWGLHGLRGGVTYGGRAGGVRGDGPAVVEGGARAGLRLRRRAAARRGLPRPLPAARRPHRRRGPPLARHVRWRRAAHSGPRASGQAAGIPPSLRLLPLHPLSRAGGPRS